MSGYLITGGEGFVGSKIAQATGGVSYDLKSGFDILDEAQLSRVVANNRDGIFHCAARISVPESFSATKAYYRTNVEGTRLVVRVAEQAKSRIIFSSSAAVYGDISTAVREDSALSPKSPYAQNKIDGESLLKISGRPHLALRYFNIYGPGQSAQYAGVITSFIISALSGNDLIIYGDGNQVRDFVFISDVVRANLMAMNFKNKSFGVFNIGSGQKTTIKNLAEMVCRLTNSSSKINYQAARPGDITYSQADVSQARRLLNWRAEVSLESGLGETIAYYRNQLKGL